MAQTLGEIQQSLTTYVRDAQVRVGALTVQLREARKDFKAAEKMLKRMGGPVRAPKAAPEATPAAGVSRATDLRGRVLTALRKDGPLAPGRLWEEAQAETLPFADRRATLDALIDEGLVEIVGKAGGTRIRLREQP